MKKVWNQVVYNLKKDRSSYISFGIIILITAVDDILGNTNLLFVLLVGVRVVGVYDTCRILKLPFIVHLKQIGQIFIVVIWKIASILGNGTTQNGVCKRIARSAYFIAAICKFMWMLRCINRV